MTENTYTPSEAEVRGRHNANAMRDSRTWRMADAEFDRWLAEHEAALLERMADELEAPSPANLFKWAAPARAWLRARAAEIRKERDRD